MSERGKDKADDEVEDLDVPRDDSDDVKGGGADYLLQLDGVKREPGPDALKKLPGKRTPPTIS